MVGALADWFAVTALFRHPLGIPIPHTAIVVERKEQFGQTLATFFRENFLSGATVADRVRTSAAVARASTWLADPEHATTFVRNVLQRSGSVLDANAERVVDAIVGEIRHVTTAVPLDRGVGDDRARGGREPSARRRHRRGLHRGTTRDPPARRRPRGDLHRGASLVAPRGRPTPGLRAPGRPDRRCARRHCSRPGASGSGTSCARRWSELADRLEHDDALGARLRDLQRAVALDPRVDEMVTSLVTGVVDGLRADARTPGSRLEERLVDRGDRCRGARPRRSRAPGTHRGLDRGARRPRDGALRRTTSTRW